MKVSELIEQRLARLRVVARALHKSLRTEETYCGWVRRFIQFAATDAEARGCGPEEIARLFVEAHAAEWAVATQDQFRNALVFYYKHVLKKPLGRLGDWARARRPQRLPVWLSHAQMLDLISHLRGLPRLMAELDYGSGLRSHELVTLRVKDLDFTARSVTVRAGKGDKDRVTFLPLSCIDDLQSQLRESRLVWERDRRNGLLGVFLPDTLESKYPNAGSEWAWQWIWPSRETSIDPRSGLRRRHHVHETAFQKAVKAAGSAAGLSKRVHPHLFRHSFSCEYLLQGGAIHELQALLGHASLLTTQAYLHCVSPAIGGMRSPLDRSASKVVPFQPHYIKRSA